MRVLHSRNGHKATEQAGFLTKLIPGSIAVIIVITAIFLLWWKGIFLPAWISWENRNYVYEDVQAELANRTVTLRMDDPSGTEVWRTPWDWSVQELLCCDVNLDGRDELVLLVWKHGSYGNHLPFWEKKNDFRLKQHIFIYQWEETREKKLRAVWMSSSLDGKIASLEADRQNRLVITDTQNHHTRWQWQGFGLKYAGDAKDEQVTFLCVGDHLIHPQMLLKKEDDYRSFYAPLKEEIQKADFSVVNQETIFVKEKALISGFPRFGTPLEVGEALVDAGFDVVTLANNHVLDQGTYGVDTTCAFYEEKGITYLGASPTWKSSQDPAEGVTILKKNGIRMALINATYGTNGIPTPEEYPYMVERLADEERLILQLDYARNHADAVLVFVHWGTEYDTRVDEKQEYYTELFLTHGVDVVIGTHPHVLQKYEKKKNEQGHEMLVYYSLGNFISAQKKASCQMGGLAKFTISKSFLGDVSIQEATLQKIKTDHDENGYMVRLSEE